MGATSPDEYYLNKYIEEQNKKLKLETKMKMRQIDNYYANTTRQNKIRSDLIKANAQKQMDVANRKYIIEYHGHLGYNLNPYQMSSSELQFWRERMYTKISQK